MSETVTPARRGRDNRRARAQSIAVKYPYIRRRLKPVELLSTEATEVIEANAETILEEVGIEFRRDPESLRLWRGAGADVQDERVRIPRGMARKLLATAPEEFTLFARNPERHLDISTHSFATRTRAARPRRKPVVTPRMPWRSRRLCSAPHISKPTP